MAFNAAIPGERGNARAIPVPTRTRDVAWATRVAWVKAPLEVSVLHTESNPRSSMARAREPISWIGPPTVIPYRKVRILPARCIAGNSCSGSEVLT